MISSPLGQYSQVIAAAMAVFLIAAFILASIFQHALGLLDQQLTDLRFFAAIAGGAVFGASAAVNGWKEPTKAAHARMDRLQTAVSVIASKAVDTTVAPEVAEVLSPFVEEKL
jgi:hypothetical protein